MAIHKLGKSAVVATAPAHIEAHETESALRSAQYALDRKLYDLRNRYHAEEVKLRDEYLQAVIAITSGGSEDE